MKWVVSIILKKSWIKKWWSYRPAAVYSLSLSAVRGLLFLHNSRDFRWKNGEADTLKCRFVPEISPHMYLKGQQERNYFEWSLKPRSHRDICSHNPNVQISPTIAPTDSGRGGSLLEFLNLDPRRPRTLQQRYWNSLRAFLWCLREARLELPSGQGTLRRNR